MFGYKSKPEECLACKAKSEHIASLNEIIKQREEAWKNERAEYKRTVDRLLMERQIAPVGEGVRQPAAIPSQPVNINSLWDEVKSEQPAGDGF